MSGKRNALIATALVLFVSAGTAFPFLLSLGHTVFFLQKVLTHNGLRQATDGPGSASVRRSIATNLYLGKQQYEELTQTQAQRI